MKKTKSSKTINKNNKKNGKKKAKKKYKLRNWHEYNESLVNRGKLDVWIEENVLESWFADSTGKPGSQPIYSNMAIQLVLQFGAIFRQKLRQTEGLIFSIFNLMNIGLPVPDYTTLCRRAGNLEINLSCQARNNDEKKIIIVDSSGLKVYGEGEWKVRQHGISKRRTWKKIHLIITPEGEIRKEELTENNIADSQVLPKLLNRIPNQNQIEKLFGDGGYDRRSVYNSCNEHKVQKIIIPPQENAKIWQHGNCKAKPHPRDENLRLIRKTSKNNWKKETGYNTRSLVETTMYRFKTIFGDKLNARKTENEKTEARLKCSILNKMMQLGMPDSYAIT